MVYGNWCYILADPCMIRCDCSCEHVDPRMAHGDWHCEHVDPHMAFGNWCCECADPPTQVQTLIWCMENGAANVQTLQPGVWNSHLKSKLSNQSSYGYTGMWATFRATIAMQSKHYPALFSPRRLSKCVPAHIAKLYEVPVSNIMVSYKQKLLNPSRFVTKSKISGRRELQTSSE